MGKIVSSDDVDIKVDCDMIKVKVPIEQLMKPSKLYLY